ncbi:AzlD domain-containing protein [Thermomonospora catenispora]|uniref:AzlD domain-containing protein n=1 Tax=Thermomonospora catenispora TaxID=2493090 RepID=UPI001121A92E|nr:AzlD domain-containing protein [Thermomonospora catenispora]TNY36746.1 AzlD domain-containing protein [Thermomonospora catenispora]
MMPVWAVAVLAAGTYAFRAAGPLLRGRVRLPGGAERTLAATATVLLVALAAVSTLTEGGAFAGWARVLGVTTAGIAAVRGAPFPVVVIAAAVVTAALRLCGVD